MGPLISTQIFQYISSIFCYFSSPSFNTMKFQTSQLQNAKYSSSIKLLLRGLTILSISLIPLCVLKNSPSPLPSLLSPSLNSTDTAEECNIFSGKWVPNPTGPYYTNETCHLIIDQQNCMKHGRPDTEFMKWRWKPDGCELPQFDAVQFLEVVRDTKMAFVGDSVGRNQMQSLLCLLSSVANPEDMSEKYFSDTIYFQRWYYAEYNFTVAALWSPFLVKARADTFGNGYSVMNLYLDQPDEAWTSQIESFDYVIVSAGQWFFRPVMHYMNNKAVGCYNCNKDNVTDLTIYYGYKMAFRTTFKALMESKRYKGMTFLRTFSPAHFENGAWNAGGSCPRTRPFTKEELKEEYEMELYKKQVEEVKKAEEEGKKRGLKFKVLETTEAMLLRPDGHPNHYGHALGSNKSTADCVHWCLPGPIDTWNEFLLYMLKKEEN